VENTSSLRQSSLEDVIHSSHSQANYFIRVINLNFEDEMPLGAE
jgi:hypothetical protein